MGQKRLGVLRALPFFLFCRKIPLVAVRRPLEVTRSHHSVPNRGTWRGGLC